MTPRPASTVVVVRDHAEGNGVETLLLLRNTALTFEGGAWVFPGGKVDPCDYPQDASGVASEQLHHQAAINAGIRETHEEAGLIIHPDNLIPIAHWTTPLGLSRRYATWFFLCPLQECVEIIVDADEILDYQWLTPATALREHSAGRIRLPVPTAFTLKSFLPFRSIRDLCTAMRCADIHVFPENSDHYQPVMRSV